MAQPGTLDQIAELVSKAACDLNDARALISERAADPFVGKLPDEITRAHDDMGKALSICENIETGLRKFIERSAEAAP